MKNNQYQELKPFIEDNTGLRDPQRFAYEAIRTHDFGGDGGREVGVVLPVGCGKSGLLALAPFAVGSKRTLLVAPNLNIADQLFKDLVPANEKFFYGKRKVLVAPPYPEPAEIRGSKTNVTDLHDADIVVTNIQQLQRENNVWLGKLPADFFDLILFDEAHHNVAESWETLRTKFPNAGIVNVSATPARADGRLMSGEIIYSYPISEAVKNGFVKRVNGHRLSPQTLKYVRFEGDEEVEVSLEEVRRLGETDAKFRRSIVSSEETLTTIVDASLRKLAEMREVTGENRLKIIASALNMAHCKQIVAKYAERGYRADFVHSKQDSKANEKVHTRLENNELDVIVQVRKLGEGFDHPYLSVAAVFSIFSNLGPFMQFVGRIMRVIPGVDPFDKVNDGVVVFHVGGNITGVWDDFTDFADADQEYFANLVDEDFVEPVSTGEYAQSRQRDETPLPTITSQTGVQLENIELLSNDRAMQAIQVLKELGVTTEQFEELKRMTPTKQASRQAKRKQLDELVKTGIGRVLSSHKLPYPGHELDKARRGKTNFEVLKGAIDKKIKGASPSGVTKRAELSNHDLDILISGLNQLIEQVEGEYFNE